MNWFQLTFKFRTTLMQFALQSGSPISWRLQLAYCALSDRLQAQDLTIQIKDFYADAGYRRSGK